MADDSRTWELSPDDPPPPEGTKLYTVAAGLTPDQDKVGWVVPRRYQFDYTYRLWEDTLNLPNGFCLPGTDNSVEESLTFCTCPVISQLSLYDDLHSDDCLYGKALRRKK